MLTRRAMHIRVTDQGEIHLTVAFPRSVRLLPVPEAFREIERTLSDAQDGLEAAVLGEPRPIVAVETSIRRAG